MITQQGRAIMNVENNKKTNISTKRLNIRPIDLEDANPTYLGWIRNGRSNPYIENIDPNYNIDDLKKYVQDKINNPNVLFLAIIDKSSDKHIGNIKFEPVDYKNKSTTMGILIGDESFRGKGYAREVIRVTSDWLKVNWGIEKIHLGVSKNNVAAYKAYLKSGFRPTHILNPENNETITMIRRNSPCLKLALGTAQFGFDYGVSNKSGRVSHNETERILDRAWEAGMGVLDTAISYGDSETVLGDIGTSHWNIITKIPEISVDDSDIHGNVYKLVTDSMRRLKVKNLHGVLLHRPSQIFNNEGNELLEALKSIKEGGLVKKIGVSVYNPDELESIWNVFTPDIVQAPLNIMDRRLESSGWLSRLKSTGVEVHTRSCFLQGLLLMSPEDRPSRFSKWQKLFYEWDLWLEESSISPVKACLDYVLSHDEVDYTVVGVESVVQLEEIISYTDAPKIKVPDSISCSDEDLVNPSRW